MLNVPSSALNGRYESPIVTQDVALALARKVTGLQRQLVLELRTPSPDRKPSETIVPERQRDAEEKRTRPEEKSAPATVTRNAIVAEGRLDILV
jgi:hypothetical protein